MANKDNTNQKIKTARSPETREQQMIALAVDAAEKQLREGKASSQVICHYLKLGSTRERQEREKAEEEIKLLKAKTESIKAAQHLDEVYAEAIKAMKTYTGQVEEE